MTLGGHTYQGASLPTPARQNDDERVTFSYAADPYQVDVVYELRRAGRFVTKRLVVRKAPAGRFMLDDFTLFQDAVAERLREDAVVQRARPNLGTGDYGAFLHFDKSHGPLVTAQNPFLAFHREGQEFSLR